MQMCRKARWSRGRRSAFWRVAFHRAQPGRVRARTERQRACMPAPRSLLLPPHRFLDPLRCRLNRRLEQLRQILSFLGRMIAAITRRRFRAHFKCASGGLVDRGRTGQEFDTGALDQFAIADRLAGVCLVGVCDPVRPCTICRLVVEQLEIVSGYPTRPWPMI